MAAWALQDRKTSVSVATAGLSLLAAIIACGLSFVEHAPSPTPSIVLSAWLFLSIILDIPRTRTLWMMGYPSYLWALFVASLALKLVSLAFEEANKRRFVYPGHGPCPDEECAGLINRTLFLWLNRLIKNGYSTALEAEQLPYIDRALLSEPLWATVGQHWDRGMPLLLSHHS
jgi:ATP-binding cassette, subfamily C (CFTR/MRP), member 1